MSDNKGVMSIKELAEIKNMNVHELVAKGPQNGWVLKQKFLITRGALYIYEDNRGIRYTVEFESCEDGTLKVKNLLRISNVVIDFMNKD